MTRKNGTPLSGVTALITGGSRGIGRAICLELAQLGSHVAFLYLSHDHEAELTISELHKTKSWARAYRADVSDAAVVEEAVRDLVSSAPAPLSILVNNAGITRDKTIAKMTSLEWQEVISTNLNGAFNAIKAVLPHMLQNKYGRIVSIASIIGQAGGFGQANYAASKAGLIALTKTLALELATKNITANAVAPGWIETSMLAEVPEDVRSMLLTRIPLKRFGVANQVAETVTWLCLPSANYITGQTICINGGAYLPS